MESRRTKSGKTSTPGWNWCDISDDFRENKAPANVPGFLFRCQLLAQSGHRLVRCTCQLLTQSGHRQGASHGELFGVLNLGLRHNV